MKDAATGVVGTLVRGATGAVARVLFPPACPGCGADTLLHGGLCAACWSDTQFLSGNGCRTCGRPLEGKFDDQEDLVCDICLDNPPLWDRGVAVAHYGGTMRRLILRLKHGDRLDLAPVLGAAGARAGAALLREADFIAPVPSHWLRRLKRRYNQSAELARAVASAAGRGDAYVPGLLRRTRRTPSQEGRDREGRAANLSGAISLAPRWRERVAGRSVLLVDDVLTTGATFNAAAAALRGAGAGRVDVIAMALVKRSGLAYLGTDDEDQDPEAEDGQG